MKNNGPIGRPRWREVILFVIFVIVLTLLIVTTSGCASWDYRDRARDHMRAYQENPPYFHQTDAYRDLQKVQNRLNSKQLHTWKNAAPETAFEVKIRDF